MLNFLRSLDKNEVSYWLGLILLFIGLRQGVSTATALVVVGSILTLVSIITSFFLTWLSARGKVK